MAAAGSRASARRGSSATRATCWAWGSSWLPAAR